MLKSEKGDQKWQKGTSIFFRNTYKRGKRVKNLFDAFRSPDTPLSKNMNLCCFSLGILKCRALSLFWSGFFWRQNRAFEPEWLVRNPGPQWS
jgi:hypothetical protein